MAAIPLWLTGRFLTSVVATVQSVDSSGNLTNSTGTDIATLAGNSLPVVAGVIDTIELNCSKTTENISPASETRAQYVPIARRDSATLTEIMRQNATNTSFNNLLANLWHSATSRYVLLQFTRSGNSWSGYFVMKSYDEELRRGRCIARMTLDMVDPGQTNAAFS